MLSSEVAPSPSSPPREPVALELLDLPDSLLLDLLLQLPAADVLSCRSSCTRICALASDDAVWAPLCLQQFGLTELKTPPLSCDVDGRPCPSYMIAAREWMRMVASLSLDRFRERDGTLRTLAPLTFAAADIWAKLEHWCALNLPEVGSTFSGPVAQETWDSFQQEVLGMEDADSMVRTLLPLRLLTAFHDGQHMAYDLLVAVPSGAIQPTESLAAMSEEMDDHVLNRQRSLGLLGGYSAYDTCVSTRLFPLRLMAGWTKVLRQRIPFEENHVVLGASFDLTKHINLDLLSGDVVITGLVFETPVKGHPSSWRDDGQTVPLLSWLGEFAKRLTAGEFGEAELVPLSPETRGITLLPQIGPRSATAVTRGIEVKASAVHAHEQDFVIYSIRIRLLRPHEPGYQSPSQRGFETAQLQSRHWVIKKSGHPPQSVFGEGVVGKYPLLMPDGWRDDEINRSGHVEEGAHCTGTFVYQSRCEPRDSFEGELIFVPGSLNAPTGAPFEVTVAQFSLARSEDEWAF